MLQPVVDEQVWVAERPSRFHGVDVRTRMTIVRLPSGELWVHSPVEADVALKREIDALGRVAFVVAPSSLHHAFARPFFDAYPRSELFVSPRLPEKSGVIAFATPLDDTPPSTWAKDLAQVTLKGHRYIDEVVFLHRPSRTLIVADLLESVHDDAPWALRAIGRMAGIYDRPGPPMDMRFAFRDIEATRASLERILAWDFDRIVLSHGKLIARGGKRALREAYRFLLEPLVAE